MKFIDVNAPIIPYYGLGNIQLGRNIKEFYDILKETLKSPQLIGKFLITYEIDNILNLCFNINNGKLVRITALKNYKGKLFNNIYIGMDMKEVLKIDKSFVYDDIEEGYENEDGGVYIESDAQTEEIVCISVFLREIENPGHEKGDW